MKPLRTLVLECLATRKSELLELELVRPNTAVRSKPLLETRVFRSWFDYELIEPYSRSPHDLSSVNKIYISR